MRFSHWPTLFISQLALLISPLQGQTSANNEFLSIRFCTRARNGARQMNATTKSAIILSLYLLLVLGLATNAVAADKADYVFKNGAIYTIDAKNPTAQAIAITGK